MRKWLAELVERDQLNQQDYGRLLSLDIRDPNLELLNQQKLLYFREVLELFLIALPDLKDLDNIDYENIWLLTKHDPYLCRKYFDLFKSLCLKGVVSKREICIMTDFLLLADGKKQLYGTTYYHREGRNKIYWFEGSIEDVIERRDKDGANDELFQSVYTEAEMHNVDLSLKDVAIPKDEFKSPL